MKIWLLLLFYYGTSNKLRIIWRSFRSFDLWIFWICNGCYSVICLPVYLIYWLHASYVMANNNLFVISIVIYWYLVVNIKWIYLKVTNIWGIQNQTILLFIKYVIVLFFILFKLNFLNLILFLHYLIVKLIYIFYLWFTE